MYYKGVITVAENIRFVIHLSKKSLWKILLQPTFSNR